MRCACHVYVQSIHAPFSSDIKLKSKFLHTCQLLLLSHRRRHRVRNRVQHTILKRKKEAEMKRNRFDDSRKQHQKTFGARENRRKPMEKNSIKIYAHVVPNCARRTYFGCMKMTIELVSHEHDRVRSNRVHKFNLHRQTIRYLNITPILCVCCLTMTTGDTANAMRTSNEYILWNMMAASLSVSWLHRRIFSMCSDAKTFMLLQNKKVFAANVMSIGISENLFNFGNGNAQKHVLKQRQRLWQYFHYLNRCVCVSPYRVHDILPNSNHSTVYT